MAFVTEVLALQMEDGMARAGLMSVQTGADVVVDDDGYRAREGERSCLAASWHGGRPVGERRGHGEGRGDGNGRVLWRGSGRGHARHGVLLWRGHGLVWALHCWSSSREGTVVEIGRAHV